MQLMQLNAPKAEFVHSHDESLQVLIAVVHALAGQMQFSDSSIRS